MSSDGVKSDSTEVDEVEIQEWIESLDYVLKNGSTKQAKKILAQLQIRAQKAGVTLPFTANTPYINKISTSEEQATT